MHSSKNICTVVPVIRINGGKTEVWNQAGIRQGACDVVGRVAWASDPHAHVWKGRSFLEERQGMKSSRSASPTRTSAFWASWANSLAMIHARFKEVASQFVYVLENDLGGPHFRCCKSPKNPDRRDGIRASILASSRRRCSSRDSAT